MDPKNTNPPASGGQNQGQSQGQPTPAQSKPVTPRAAKPMTPPPAQQGQQYGQVTPPGAYPPPPYPPAGGQPPMGQQGAQGGYYPPQGAYPPQGMPGGNPQQTTPGYPPMYGDPYAQQGGYATMNMPMPPQQGGYYPPQGAYQPPAGYPPQGSYPQGAYPPPGAYPPAGNYAPQGGGYPPAGGQQPGGAFPPVPPEDTTPANFQLGTKFQAKLNVTAPKSELKYDAPYFIRLLAGSISLSKDEKKKIIESIPKLKQAQIDELIRIFEEEKQKFAALSKKHVPQLEKLAQQHFDEWMDLEHEWGQSQKKTEDSGKAEAIRKQLGL